NRPQVCRALLQLLAILRFWFKPGLPHLGYHNNGEVLQRKYGCVEVRIEILFHDLSSEGITPGAWYDVHTKRLNCLRPRRGHTPLDHSVQYPYCHTSPRDRMIAPN